MKPTLLFCFASLVLLASPIEAAITYDLFIRTSVGDGLDTTVQVNPGQQIGGTVVLRETISGTNDSLFAAANLNAFNATVSASGSDGRFDELTIDASGGADFGSSADTITYSAFGPILSQPGKSATEVGSDVREIVLGSLQLFAPTGGETTFTVADATSADGDFTTFNSGASGLESLSVESGGGFFGRSLTVTAIPEPSSIAMLAIGSCGLLIRRRRR
jgi:hypothetical protein